LAYLNSKRNKMTVSSDVNKITYAGNGSTQVFSVNYYFLADSHLQVVLITTAGVETVQTLTTNYTVTGAGNEAGGSITMLVAPPTGVSVVIQRVVPATQETDYLANDPFPAESHERALDKLTMLVQQNERENDRSLKIPLSAVPTTSTELPAPVGNKLLAWNSNASAITNFDPADIITIVGQQTSYGDVFTGNGVTTDFTLARSPGSVFGLDVSINGVTQVPNVDYTLGGTTLTFTSAPPAAASQILARYAEVYEEVSADAQNVRYVPAGTGAVTTTVQAKLRETVSVKDFGAVGDGVTDDTAAVNAAFVHAVTVNKTVYIPAGAYKISSTIIALRPFYGDGQNRTLFNPTVAMTAVSISPSAFGIFQGIGVNFTNVGAANIDATCIGFNFLPGTTAPNEQLQYCRFQDLAVFRAGYSFYKSPSSIGQFYNVVFDNCISFWPKYSSYYFDHSGSNGALQVEITRADAVTCTTDSLWNGGAAAGWNVQNGFFIKGISQLAIRNSNLSDGANGVNGSGINIQDSISCILDNVQYEIQKITAPGWYPIAFFNCPYVSVDITLQAWTLNLTGTIEYIYADANVKQLDLVKVQEFSKTTTSGSSKFVYAQGATTYLNVLDHNITPTLCSLGATTAKNAVFNLTSSFSGTITGCTTTPSATFKYARSGQIITITGGSLVFNGLTSNATTKTITGIPASISPSATVYFLYQATDNGGTAVTGLGSIGGTTITLYPTITGGNWTASGICSMNIINLSYVL
jgi:hypothetical protein